MRPKWEVADIFRLYGEDYRHCNRLPATHLKIMRLIERCRTAWLGGHVERCGNCSYERHAYNSCRNRHCPKCQTLAKEKWLQDRKREILPVSYFHNVFTLPHELNPLVLVNKTAALNILFRSVAETLQAFAKDPQWKLGGQLGFIAVLHTWNKTLLDHFHLHCVIPAGVLSWDRQRWIPSRENFLFPVKALSLTFRGKFLCYLKEAYQNNKLIFPGRTISLKPPKAFYNLIGELYKKDWVVYSKRPFAGPEQVLSYLARYTHRVAISNNRILSVGEDRVTFSYRDHLDHDQLKKMILSSHEFIRRFLLHVLPNQFMRIRHFGFLANVSKKTAIPAIRQCLGQSNILSEKTDLSIRERMLDLVGIDITSCPNCKSGTMVIITQLPKRVSGHDP